MTTKQPALETLCVLIVKPATCEPFKERVFISRAAHISLGKRGWNAKFRNNLAQMHPFLWFHEGGQLFISLRDIFLLQNQTVRVRGESFTCKLQQEQAPACVSSKQ